MKYFKLALIASAVAATGMVNAATQGTLGTDSTGTSIVTIIKLDAVMISDVGDLNLGTFASLAADETEADDICVFNSTASYTITFTSANGSFQMQDGGAAIPYSMGWATNGGASAPVTYNTPIPGQIGDSVSTTCGGGTNANFSVTVGAAAFNAAAPGTYTDTVTMFVQAL